MIKLPIGTKSRIMELIATCERLHITNIIFIEDELTYSLQQDSLLKWSLSLWNDTDTNRYNIVNSKLVEPWDMFL